MLGALSEKLQGVFKTLRGYGKLSESNVADAVREVRMALLAADVHYEVARDFCQRIKDKSLGQEVQGSIRPGDLFVKIVHDELLGLFSQGERDLTEARPLRLMLCGLNGSGKTTTSAKLALHLRKEKENVLLVAADLARPAAIQQLQTLGKQINVPVLAPEAGMDVLAHVQRVEAYAKEHRHTVVIFDTAGRLEVDEALLKELEKVSQIIQPQETLLVVDSATGQTAVDVAKAFKQVAPITGLVLSKFDGDAKGGAALSIQTVTQCPIKFLGIGEQLPALEVFAPERLVSRMLGMGDIVGLVEKAQLEIDSKDAERLAQKIHQRTFNLQDFLDQLRMIKKLGPLQNLLGMIPGLGNLPNSAIDDNALKRTEAIIQSMTRQERANPDILNGRRRQRIASGSGTTVMEVNDLIHRFGSMKKIMGDLTRGGNKEKKMKDLLSRLKM